MSTEGKAGIGKWALRIFMMGSLAFALFYLGRPLYWKVSASLHDIRENNDDSSAVQPGFTELVQEAKRSVGWELRKEPDEPEKQGENTGEASIGRKLSSFRQAAKLLKKI